VVHNTAMNSSDNLPRHVILQTTITAQMMSIGGQGDRYISRQCMWHTLKSVDRLPLLSAGPAVISQWQSVTVWPVSD